jgi:aminoglycoside phosphotransferase (APT) family kinase protein
MADVLEPEIVDLQRVAAWMDERGLGSGPISDAELITGGTQNVLVRFRRSGREFVLRRPPPHKRANSDETMRREARVLGALAGTDVPHPALIAAEPELDVIGAAFYLMEPVDGFNATLGLPEPHDSDLDIQHAMGLSMADAIAALARVDLAERALTDLGRPDGWVDRQVARWRKQLDGYSDLPGYPGPAIPRLDDVARWLDENRPAEARMGLIHGDFHFANVLIARDAGRVAAIVDWELATIGDPLLDLGHLLSAWPHPDGGGIVPIGEAPGLPAPEEVIARYGAQSDRDLSDLTWFRVLACYRLGIILEGSHARAFSGLTPVEIGDQLHRNTLGLFAQAADLIDSEV